MITRRELFRGAALGVGGVYLAPFLRQLEAAAATTGPAAGKPMRFVFFLQGNGVYPDQIQPVGIPMPKTPDRLDDQPLAGHAFPRALEPMEPFRDRMTIVHGLSGRVTGPPSHSCDFGALGCYPGTRGVFGETIDGALAKAFPGIFPHVGLGVMGNDTAVVYNVSAWDRNKALPTQCQPTLAYQRLFASAATGNARQAFDAKTNVLDFLGDDVKRVQSRLNSDEKGKLDYYLDAFESMSSRQADLAKAADRIAKHAPRNSEAFPRGAGGLAHLEAQFSVAAGAIIAGLTNVVTISSGSGLEFKGIKVDGADFGFDAGPIDLHGIGHGGSFCGRTAAEIHVAIRRRHMEALAGFVKQLSAIPEGDGTMMDNTLILYTSDQAEGHHPRCHEWPFILVGDLGGRLKTRGRYLRYPWYGKPGHRTIANMYNTLLDVAGKRRPRFGLPDLALRDLDQDGPLAELMA